MDNPEQLIMYGYIYKTTNTINGKFYIGQHKSTSLDPKYFGSGNLLREAIDKYGIENFRCEILDWGETKEELTIKEQEWIAKTDALNHQIAYNLHPGGCSPGPLSQQGFEERSRASSERLKARWQDETQRPKLLEMCRQNGFTSHLTEERKQYLREHPLFQGKKHSDESKKKMSDAKKKNLPAQCLKGNNPNSGKRWYHNGTEQVLATPGTQPDGWVLGKLDEIGRKWYNNGKESMLVAPGQNPDGWVEGRLPFTKKYYNDGTTTKLFVEGSQPQGWVEGRLHKNKSVI